MPGWRTGSGVVVVVVVKCQELKQGSKRFNSITKTSHFAHLGTLVTVSMVLLYTVTLSVIRIPFTRLATKKNLT